MKVTDLAKATGSSLFEELVDKGNLPSGCEILDSLMGGGFPLGMATEIVGDFSTGKSLLGLMACREAAKHGGFGVYIDNEHAVDPTWARKIGIDPGSTIYKACYSLEDTYDYLVEVLEELIKAKNDSPVIIVWDSVPASVPESIKTNSGSKTAAQARVNSERLPDLLGPLNESGASLVMINQLRSKIGVMFGKKWESCGGRAIRFYSSLRLYLVKTGVVKGANKAIVGTKGKVEVIKSRVSRPFRKADFELLFDGGILPWAGVLETLKKAKVVEAVGGKYRFSPTRGKNTDSLMFSANEMKKVYKALLKRTDPARLELAFSTGDTNAFGKKNTAKNIRKR